MTIYYIDDSLEDYTLLTSAFRNQGYNVKVVHFTEHIEFQSAVMRDASDIDLIISDMKMPKVSGLDILNWYNEYRHLIQVPFAILSGGKDHSEILRTLENAVYFFKPTSFEGYKDLVHQLVNSYGPLTCPTDPMELIR
jgi:response regulator RpfG family c-di-GMP phosphodiesterase